MLSMIFTRFYYRVDVFFFYTSFRSIDTPGPRVSGRLRSTVVLSHLRLFAECHRKPLQSASVPAEHDALSIVFHFRPDSVCCTATEWRSASPWRLSSRQAVSSVPLRMWEKIPDRLKRFAECNRSGNQPDSPPDQPLRRGHRDGHATANASSIPIRFTPTIASVVWPATHRR